MADKITFKIKITNKYTFKCSIINYENKEYYIELKNNPKEEYIPCISFTENQIIICEDNVEDKEINSIHFIQ